MRLLPKRRTNKQFRQKWIELQKLCAKPATWPEAILSADELLDEVLKKRKMKGKSMGERIVSAQRLIGDNDAIWYAHNLAKKLKEDEPPKLTQAQVKKSLVGFGKALNDLGALKQEPADE